MTNKMIFFAKLSLSFLWIFTGITSLYFSPEIGYEILAGGGVTGLPAKALLVEVAYWIFFWEYGFLLTLILSGVILPSLQPSFCILSSYLLLLPIFGYTPLAQSLKTFPSSRLYYLC